MKRCFTKYALGRIFSINFEKCPKHVQFQNFIRRTKDDFFIKNQTHLGCLGFAFGQNKKSRNDL
jgi:hypothetical protein